MPRPSKPILNAINTVIKRRVHYHADDTSAFNTSHEHAVKNPILQKFTKGAYNKTFQHPSIGRITCVQNGCDNKICDKPCDIIKEKCYVGHGTHSNYPGSVYLSSNDFDNKPRQQNGLFYNKLIKNYDHEGKNHNNDRTTNMNNNKDMQTLVHIYASKNPLDD